MGKYIRKNKISAEVAVMEPTLGVHTRARTLALQRQQPSGGRTPPSSGDDSSEYLQLRSRRLEKNSNLKPRGEKEKPSCRRSGYPQKKSETKASPSVENSGSITRVRTRKQAGCSLVGERGPEKDAEGSVGDNSPGFEQHKERGTRESTPCSFIRDTDVAAPGSSTKAREASTGNQTNHDVNPLNIPSEAEIDEFFAREQEQEQRRFMDKYNFDIVNDVPLPGRYEWERVAP